MTRRLLRLVVPTPDRRRVLARPNGLAGWTLPAVPVPAGDDAAWPPEADEAAARVIGAAVRPVRRIADGAWEVEALGRIPRSGTTWIAPDEAERLGSDRHVLLAWAAAEPADPAS